MIQSRNRRDVASSTRKTPNEANALGRCGKTARRDLCRGHRVTGVPTSTPKTQPSGVTKLFPGILIKFKGCVRENRYVVTMHGDEEMDEDELSIFDVERAILTGAIIERQKDGEKGEWKYIVRGQAMDGSEIAVVAKLGLTNRMVIITVYRDE